MKYHSLAFAVLWLSGCAADSSAGECSPAGEWIIDFEVGAGDCIEPGTVLNEVLVIDEDGERFRAYWVGGEAQEYVGFDETRCTVNFVGVFDYEATEDRFAISGADSLVLEIDGDTVSRSENFSATIETDGGPVECEQKQTLTGERAAL